MCNSHPFLKTIQLSEYLPMAFNRITNWSFHNETSNLWTIQNSKP